MNETFETLYRSLFEVEIHLVPQLLDKNPDGQYTYLETRLRYEGFALAKADIAISNSQRQAAVEALEAARLALVAGQAPEVVAAQINAKVQELS